MTSQEQQEREHLARVQEKLRRALQTIDARVKRYAEDVKEQKTYLWESRADMDHVEKVFTRQTIQQSVLTGEAVAAHQARITRLLQSPYFGRFDFKPDAGDGAERVYVGVHHFTDDEAGGHLVYDWRAPISTMFYDHETGPASYCPPRERSPARSS